MNNSLNITEELKVLKRNIYKYLGEHNIRIDPDKTDMSFNPHNWIITFPFNFYALEDNAKIIDVRKIAVINALYGYYFICEDDILDEYGLPAREYNLLIQKYCAAHVFRNYAIDQLISFSGSAIYDFINEYENQYYQTLLNEKKFSAGILATPGLSSLGLKAIPICIPFAAFCLKFNCIKYLKHCEKLVKNYHIAHQLYDDLIDIHSDFNKPDGSWILKNIFEQSGRCLQNVDEITGFFKETNYDNHIIKKIKSHLVDARKFAYSLNFSQFIDHIEYLDHLADSYRCVKY